MVRKFQTKDATVAKLFAKHIKIEDSIKFLKSRRTGIAVGTPTRLMDLMTDGLIRPFRDCGTPWADLSQALLLLTDWSE